MIFFEKTGIPLDPVYTGKMFFGVIDLIHKGYFPEGSCILLIHTGGLQGIAGMNRELLRKKLPIIKT
jgi:1-aminocyclopropane-1-carboxylate deaminase